MFREDLTDFYEMEYYHHPEILSHIFMAKEGNLASADVCSAHHPNLCI